MLLRILFISIVLSVCACKGKKISNEQEYLKWINDEENGLIQQKTIGDFKFSVKYIPAEYLVFRELKNKDYTQKDIDSLKKYYAHSMTFLLTVAPSDNKLNKSEGDVMYDGVENLNDYNIKSQELNFRMQQYTKVVADGNTFPAVLSAMENIYSLGNQRSVSLVFTEEKDRDLVGASEYDFVFQDEIFSTGISHFHFLKKDIQDMPEINFWQPL